MLKIIRATEQVEVDESDVISLKEASDISHRRIPSIGNLLDRGVLPWYELPTPASLKSKRVQRYTSRRAVESLPKDKRRGVSKRKTK